MDGHALGVAEGDSGLNAQSAPTWDRYAVWPQGLARLALALLALFIVLAAWAPGMPAKPSEVPNVHPPIAAAVSSMSSAIAVPGDDGKDNDLRLYRLVIERVKRGDNYYVAATELQRANHYPVAPGLTVRLPTLAYAAMFLGPIGVAAVALLLLAAVLLTMHRRFSDEPGGESFRLFGVVLLFVGLSTATHPSYSVLHEVWAAEFMALSFALHRPAQGKWLGALLAAAAALAVRETALPFVLLMGAWAGWHRRWREGAAWAALIAVFAVALTIHVQLAEAQIRPGDPISPSWLVLGGLQGFLYKVINSSSLNMLPTVIAGPAVILALFGWTGWKSPMGNFATLLTFGYALAFMIAGRDNNFYWGVIITPILFMGLAVMPFAAKSLWRRAVGAPAHG
ncbi:MAG: hypothetical protein ABIW31_03135 [Novosphingobium sp.]